MHIAGIQRESNWEPSVSLSHNWTVLSPYLPSKRTLAYNARRPPLQNIDGIYVVNLKSRPDRLASFFKSSKFNLRDVHVFDAVDGQVTTLRNCNRSSRTPTLTKSSQALRLNDEIRSVFANCGENCFPMHSVHCAAVCI